MSHPDTGGSGRLGDAVPKRAGRTTARTRELFASFEQSRQVDVSRTRELSFSDEPSVDEVRKLFNLLELDLPSSFTDRDVVDIIRRTIRPKNPYW
jgi:hypothetical protein